MALWCMSFLYRVLSKISVGNAAERQDIRHPDKPYMITHNMLRDHNVAKCRVAVLRQPPRATSKMSLTYFERFLLPEHPYYVVTRRPRGNG